MRKIGLIGRQGSGKDYFAEQFMKENPNVALVRMADPIKVVSANLFLPICEQMNLQDNATFEAMHKENAFPIPLTYFEAILKIHIDYLIDLYFANKGCNEGQKLETIKQDLQNKALELFQDKMNEIFVVLSPRHFQNKKKHLTTIYL